MKSFARVSGDCHFISWDSFTPDSGVHDRVDDDQQDASGHHPDRFDGVIRWNYVNGGAGLLQAKQSEQPTQQSRFGVVRWIFHFSGYIGGEVYLGTYADDNVPVRADRHGSGRAGEKRITLLPHQPGTDRAIPPYSNAG